MSITLAQYIQQNPTAELQDVHDYTEISTRMLSSKTMGLILSELNLYLIVDEISKGKHDTEILDEEGVGTGNFTNHAAKEACLLIVNTLNDGSSDGGDFNFIIGDGTTTGDKIIARTEHMRDVTMPDYSALIDALLTECKAQCNKIINPFSDCTQAQLNMAKGTYTSKPITYISGKYIAVILNEDLPERVAATLWKVRAGFVPSNGMKNVYVQETGSYIIEMTGKKSGDYEVRIPFADVDFTVELI
ncbi:hypothetical protein Q4503_16445 [Colwellia sp. 6_MG-2023]|uniref:hypothetical protein n=1 Tax=Colwellia sp. 6_MG-2023 TaxID=3062676 RepID=UPI0026E27206|nr:hypothetical protein [Colwellia sp. 6_MG-2023]MDO6489286.1 hypothetical protein [Colwellia sp. 6_MG-2023]